MAGHANNWFKPKGGPLKGQALYLSKAQQGGVKRSDILAALASGDDTWLTKINTATPKGVALSAPQPVTGTTPGLDAALVSFDKSSTAGQVINGIPLASGNAQAYATAKDVDVGEPPFTGKPGMKRSAGVLVVEPDGRVWVVAPAGAYGGYKNTFPKGTLEKDLTPQQNALKEVYEEAGLNAEITGFLGDFEGDTSVTRYYLGKRTGGSPADAHWESEHVRLATPEELAGLLNKSRDKKILAAFNALQGGKTGDPTPKPTPTPSAPQKPVQTATAGFPSDPMSLPVVAYPGGSTGAAKVQAADGSHYLRKQGSPQGGQKHLLAETVADTAYRVLGVPVPDFQLMNVDGQAVKLSTWLEGASKIKPFLDGKSEASSAVRKKLREGFAADALLGNWDAVGSQYDNVLVKDGIPYRVDNGGSLQYRAMGKLKGTDGTPKYTEFPMDIWGLRDGTNSKATQMIEAFGKLTIFDVAKQISGILPKQAELLAVIPSDLRATVSARLDNMRYVAYVATGLEQQGANSSKADTYLKKLMTDASNGKPLPSVAAAIEAYQEKWS
jgi:ADP-ribose pyrophosphatase YjhB (NUDIX family)